jgi:hypothetical protein
LAAKCILFATNKGNEPHITVISYCLHFSRKQRNPQVKKIGVQNVYRGADKSLARSTSRCILFDGENISFDASLDIYITNIHPIMIINRIYEHQNLLSL